MLKINQLQKFNISNPTTWSHHRSGWNCVLQAMQQNLHSDTAETHVVNNMDKLFTNNIIETKPWVGFLHTVIKAPQIMKNFYGLRWDASNFFAKKELFGRYLTNCKGIYTFSNHVKEFVEKAIGPEVLVNLVYHPTDFVDNLFTIDKFNNNPHKKLMLVGHWMRQWQSIFDLNVSSNPLFTPWPAGKHMLIGCDIDYGLIRSNYGLKINDSVKPLFRLDNNQYDGLLSKNVVFLPLYDVNACNTLIECMVRNTPVLTNRLPASEEYLGKDYPFFYDTLEEASAKLTPELIAEASNYLSKRDKEFLTDKFFINSIIESEIYKSL